MLRTVLLAPICLSLLPVLSWADAPLFAGQLVPGGGPARDLEVCDWNGDGVDDVATVQPQDGTLSILIGRGDGSFELPVKTLLASGDFRKTSFGDFNEDGRLDSAVTDGGSGAIAIVLGDGASGALSVTFLSSGVGAKSAQVADLDGDGHLDLAVATKLSNQAGALTVFSGDGAGGFVATSATPTAAIPQALTLADLNGDGELDAVPSTGQGSSITTIHLGTGAGSFLPFQVLSDSFASSTAAFVEDLDGNGVQDILAYSGGSSSTAQAFLADGQGGYTEVVTPLVGSSENGALADLDSDGQLDLVTLGGDKLRVWNGLGSGTFSFAMALPNGSLPEDVEIADVDGDGDLDLLCACSGGYVLIYVAQSPGQFGLVESLAKEGFTSASADFDGDGYLDLASIGFDGLELFRGVGEGLFLAPSSTLSPGFPAQDALVADFNADGTPDLAASGSLGGDTVAVVWSGNGDATFSGATVLVTGLGGQASASRLGVADLDADGDLDLVSLDLAFTALSIPSSLTTLLGDGSGGFSLAGVGSLTGEFDDLELADWNNDGLVDALLASREADSVQLRPNLGAGLFGAPSPLTSIRARHLLIAEVNGEGRPDLIVGRDGSFTELAAIDVFPGLASGGFGSPQSYPAGPGLRRLAAGDLDGDGHLDLLAKDFGRVDVLLGDGSGAFFASSSYLGGDREVLGDFDGDGRLDRFQGGGASEGDVWLNRTLAPAGVEIYGDGTPGCAGWITLSANVPPRVPEPEFGLTVASAPIGGEGFFQLFDAPSATGFEILGLKFLLDLSALTVLGPPIPMTSDLGGTGFGALPIPNLPNLVGLSLSAQAIWPWAPLAPCDPSPLGLSTSRGVTLTFLP